ncbi:MAG TPA: sulfotransferase [Acidimicrobiia bacterium]|nr:sulfotransferase [Acidimicrobiia bacterium]
MPTRRRLARWRVTVRRPTSWLRALPDVLIIGAQRCGTSSLYKYLGQHPAVSPSIRKEVEYFSTRYTEGLDWYRSHFPLRRPGSMSRPLTFEATPDYMLHPLAAERAFDLVPNARIIAMVRNPVTRAYSQYQHNLRLGHEPLPFGEALAAEPTRIEGEVDRLKSDPAYQARALRRHGYAERGKYDQQLLPWLERFPPDRFHIVKSEDFFSAPEASFDDILRFLELPSFRPGDFHNYSQPLKPAPAPDGPKVDPPPPANEEARTRLRHVLEPHISHLQHLLGRDFGWR